VCPDDAEAFASDEPPETTRTGGWVRALTAGLQAAAWWQRRGSRYQVPAAVAIGALAAVGAYVGGAAAAAGLGVSALTLPSLAEAVRSGSAVLAGFGRP
jgi:hypothetical protein